MAKRFQFECPNCASHHEAKRTDFGKPLTCQFCEQEIVIPAPKSSQIDFECPNCHTPLLAVRPAGGQSFTCEICGHEISTPPTLAAVELNSQGRTLAEAEVSEREAPTIITKKKKDEKEHPDERAEDLIEVICPCGRRLAGLPGHTVKCLECGQENVVGEKGAKPWTPPEQPTSSNRSNVVWRASNSMRIVGSVLLIGLIVFLLRDRIVPPPVMKDYRADGAREGLKEGKSAGAIAGFDAARNAARLTAYSDTLHQLRADGDFQRNPAYVVGVLVFFIILGFGTQYITLYVLRKWGILYDIDRIILGKRATEVDFENLTSGSSLATVLICVFFVSTMGCKNREQELWQHGFDANYKTGFKEGWHAEQARGTAEGEKEGIEAAQRAARTGLAWELYWNIALYALAAGITLGLASQYIILLQCRLSGRLSQFSTVAFVPAMKKSFAYSIFEAQRRLRTMMQEKIRDLKANEKLKKAKMKKVCDAFVQKSKALGSLKEFNQARLLELAEKELSAILDASDEKASRTKYRRDTDAK